MRDIKVPGRGIPRAASRFALASASVRHAASAVGRATSRSIRVTIPTVGTERAGRPCGGARCGRSDFDVVADTSKTSGALEDAQPLLGCGGSATTR